MLGKNKKQWSRWCFIRTLKPYRLRILYSIIALSNVLMAMHQLTPTGAPKTAFFCACQ
jgi:hypothetical protein